MTLTQFLGDTQTHAIPMRWNGRTFAPGNAWTLKFTIKALASQTDALRLLQKGYPAYGVTVSGCNAVVEILREDTFRTAPPFEAAEGKYVWDIQAYQVAAPNHTRTVASGTITFTRDVTRLNDFSGTVYTSENPATVIVGPPGPTETTASILAKLAPGTGGVGEIGVEYLPDIWQEVWRAGSYTPAPPEVGFSSVQPDAAWWGRVVNCDYPITLPFDAVSLLGKRFVIRSTVEVSISGAYIGDNSLLTIPAPTQAFGTTLTLIEYIGGVWRATLKYSERPATQETTVSILDKLKGTTPAASATKLGAEYFPDSTSGSVVPVAPLMRVTGTLLFNGDYAQYGESQGKPLYIKGPYKIRWTGGQWQFEAAGVVGGGIISYDNVVKPSLVIDWIRTGVEDTGGPYPTPLAVSIDGKLAQYVGQLYRDRATNKWYRWNSTEWQEDANGTPVVTSVTAPADLTVGWQDPETGIISYYVGGGWVAQGADGSGGIAQFNIDGGTPSSVYGGIPNIDGGKP